MYSTWVISLFGGSNLYNFPHFMALADLHIFFKYNTEIKEFT